MKMKMLAKQNSLTNQFEAYAKFLESHEGFSEKRASLFAQQIQDFTQSGFVPMDYYEAINKEDERGAETFLLNFRHFVQFQSTQYFQEMHQLRWELGRKYKKGGF